MWTFLAAAAPAEDPIRTLQARAQALQLSSHPGWLALGHYERTATGGYRSNIESDWFFLAAEGRQDPAAELHATLAALIEERPVPEREESARCVFGARHRWLQRQLDPDQRQLRPTPCETRDKWRAALAPRRLWLVFPSAYLNSPASMFGHTLLRLDGREVTPDTPLLAYAVNFAADTTETNGLVFAIKGLSGGYRGQFSLLPYYEKVKEYARLENRDLWEYPLSLTPDEIELLLLHLWELRGAEFRYYFLTKNCSYQLLALLKAARPGLDWGNAFDWRAIPTDTIRALHAMLGVPEYRPAMATTLAHRAAQLAPDDRTLAVQLGNGKREPAALADRSAKEQARVLDVAHDWLYYRFQGSLESRAEVVPRSQELLKARAASGARSGFSAPPKPAVSPDQGHQTRRFASSFFADEQTHGIRLRYRPAYHDFLDASAGYEEGQQLQFLDVAFAIDAEASSVALEELHIIDLVSLAPRDALFKPISWNVGTGLRRLGSVDAPLAAYLDAGPGLAWSVGRWTPYLFLQTSLEAHRRLPHGYAWAGGPQLGVVAEPLPGWRIRFEGAHFERMAGASLARRFINFRQQWTLTRNLGLRLSLEQERRATLRREVMELGLHYYF